MGSPHENGLKEYVKPGNSKKQIKTIILTLRTGTTGPKPPWFPLSLMPGPVKQRWQRVMAKNEGSDDAGPSTGQTLRRRMAGSGSFLFSSLAVKVVNNTDLTGWRLEKETAGPRVAVHRGPPPFNCSEHFNVSYIMSSSSATCQLWTLCVWFADMYS